MSRRRSSEIPAVDVDVEELTEAQTWAIFDAESRRVLGISGEEFAKRWRTEQLASSDDPRAIGVAMLLPGAWSGEDGVRRFDGQIDDAEDASDAEGHA